MPNSAAPHIHPHVHGAVDASILRSRAALAAVAQSLVILGITAAGQALVLVVSDSVALLGDLVHNLADAATAVPLGVAFLLGSARAERGAGFTVVAVILASACLVAVEAFDRLLVDPRAPERLAALAAAGLLGAAGNSLAAVVRIRAGRRLRSPALIADGDHARADALVSLGVVASAGAVTLGVPLADPLIGLAVAGVVLRIGGASWRTVRDSVPHPRTPRHRRLPGRPGVIQSASRDRTGEE